MKKGTPTYGYSPDGFVKFRLLLDPRGRPLGVEVRPFTTFHAWLKGSRMEQGERLHRLTGRSCRAGFEDRTFDIEVSQRVMDSPARLCHAIEIAGGIGFVIVPFKGAYADLRRAILQLSKAEREYQQEVLR